MKIIFIFCSIITVVLSLSDSFLFLGDFSENGNFDRAFDKFVVYSDKMLPGLKEMLDKEEHSAKSNEYYLFKMINFYEFTGQILDTLISILLMHVSAANDEPNVNDRLNTDPDYPRDAISTLTRAHNKMDPVPSAAEVDAAMKMVVAFMKMRVTRIFELGFEREAVMALYNTNRKFDGYKTRAQTTDRYRHEYHVYNLCDDHNNHKNPLNNLNYISKYIVEFHMDKKPYFPPHVMGRVAAILNGQHMIGEANILLDEIRVFTYPAFKNAYLEHLEELKKTKQIRQHEIIIN